MRKSTENFWHKIFRAFTYMGSRGAACEAISGIDIALWDIRGKALGVPIYELLGGAYRKRIQLYANSWFIDGGHNEDDYIRQAREVVAQGFTVIT